MKKRLLFFLKLAVFLAVVLFMAKQIRDQWVQIQKNPITMHWEFIPLAVLGFAGVLVSSGTVWIFMTRRMGDRHAYKPLLGAYVFSQMGKYVPGKVVLLFMRMERTGRIGMDRDICVLSTLLENLFYMISGTLVAGVTAMIYTRDNLAKYAHEHPVYLALMITAVVPLGAILEPRIFYRIVNRILKAMKRPAVSPDHQLSVMMLILSVILFVPCWLCGGFSLWACLRAVGIPGAEINWVILPGTFAASVIAGMAIGVAPGGLGPREAIQTALLGAVMLPQYGLAIAIAVGVQRLVQITAEAILGITGGIVTQEIPAVEASEKEPVDQEGPEEST